MSQYFEWIQAIGTGVAIIIGVIGFIQLKGQIKDGKRQINSLETFAEQSKKQTEQLALHLEQMKESNRIKAEELKHSEEQLNQTRKVTQLSEEKRESEKKQRILEIKPQFEQRGLQRDPDNITIPIINIGETARIISTEKLVNNSMSSTLENYVGKEIIKDGKITLIITAPQHGLNPSNCDIAQKINYEDIDGNKYYQIIEGKGNLNGSIVLQKQEILT